MDGARPYKNLNLALFMVTVIFTAGYGHQPRFIMDQHPTRDNPIIV